MGHATDGARTSPARPPISVAAAVETFGAIASNPRRLGKPLRFELEGHWSARRGPYRIVYRIDDEARTVLVVAVAHRADVYRSR
jgi:mRNA interferase RelE/StbE